MALILKDRVKETSTTAGTGTVDLDGASAGFEGFVSAVGDTNLCYYAIQDADGSAWEVGVGTVTDASPDTLSRDTVLESSNSDSLVALSAGTHSVFLTYPAGKSVYRNLNDQVVLTGSGLIFSDSTVQTTAGLASGDNISSLVNDSGYINTYSETGTLQTVTDNGSVTTNVITANGFSTTGTGNIQTLIGGTSSTHFNSTNFIGGGFSNDINDTYSVICGGDNGTIAGSHGFIGAGRDLETGPGTFCIALGGNGNTIATGSYNMVLGGLNNAITASNSYNIIVGGETNAISGVDEHSFIGGGKNNSIDGRACVVVGGQNNDIAEGVNFTFVGGGANNKSSGSYDVCCGGDSNDISGGDGFIGGGEDNICSSLQGVVVGGNSNWVHTDSRGTIVGGQNNEVEGVGSFIGAGVNNTITAADEAVICGGGNNSVTQANSFIGAGDFCTTASVRTFTGAGLRNIISAGSDDSVICGGEDNTITTNPSDQCFIGGGTNNTITAGLYVTLVGGINNSSFGSQSFLGGGNNNSSNGGFSVVIGGQNNSGVLTHSTIAGGESNLCSGDGGFIGGGHFNTVKGTDACIPGGLSNEAGQDYSIAVGKEAVTRNKGEIAQSAGSFSTPGDSQVRFLHLKKQTTNASLTTLTDDGLTDASGSWNCVIRTLQSYEVVVMGHQDDDSQHAKYTFDGAIHRASGASPTSLDANKTVNYESTGVWDCAMNVGAGGVKLQVTGQAATNINWTASVKLVESTV